MSAHGTLAEAFHGWTTGTLEWRQRCATSTSTSGETGGIAQDKLKQQLVKVTNYQPYLWRQESRGERKPKANFSKTLQTLRCPLMDTLAEAFHGWTTGTLGQYIAQFYPL